MIFIRNLYIKACLIIIFIMSQANANISNNTSAPLLMLENSSQEILNTLKQNKAKLKTNSNLINQAIIKYLLPHVDVDGMSRSVLGARVWSAATENEKHEFTNLFTKLVIKTYATPLADYNGETIKFAPHQQISTNTKFLRINSIISRLNGQKIPLSYHLVYKQNQWKIYDLSVEGVSLLQSFKSQFGQIMQHSTLKELINAMRENQKTNIGG